MSFNLTCPICGRRNGYEFRYGGEEKGPRPEEGLMTAESWVEYVHMNKNVCGVQKEWWCHRDGCGMWFIAWRDLRTSLEVERAGESDDPT